MKRLSLLVASIAVLILAAPGLRSAAAVASLPAVVQPSPPPIDFGTGVSVGGNGDEGTVDGQGRQSGSPVDGESPGSSTGNCSGCTYRWTSACDPSIANACGNLVGLCPAGFVMETLIINNPALPNPTLGATECRSATGATPAQVQQAAVDAFSQLLTTAHPTQQPGGGSLVNLPTLFATNTPQTQTFNETLLGVPVKLNVQATWTWDFGDGTTLVSTIPGGQYPDTSLSHVYLAAGQYTIQLTTNWTGTFSMAGGAPAVIPGGAIPRVSVPFTLPVHEARGVLVTG